MILLWHHSHGIVRAKWKCEKGVTAKLQKVTHSTGDSQALGQQQDNDTGLKVTQT